MRRWVRLAALAASLAAISITASQAPPVPSLSGIGNSLSFVDAPPRAPKGATRWYYVVLNLNSSATAFESRSLKGFLDFDPHVATTRYVSCEAQSNTMLALLHEPPRKSGCNSGGNIGLTPEFCLTARPGPHSEAAAWDLTVRYSEIQLHGLSGATMLISKSPARLCQVLVEHAYAPTAPPKSTRWIPTGWQGWVSASKPLALKYSLPLSWRSGRAGTIWNPTTRGVLDIELVHRKSAATFFPYQLSRATRFYRKIDPAAAITSRVVRLPVGSTLEVSTELTEHVGSKPLRYSHRDYFFRDATRAYVFSYSGPMTKDPLNIPVFERSARTIHFSLTVASPPRP
jgi:hypothetical protein